MKNKWYFNDVSIVDDIIKYLKDDGDITIIDLNVKEYE